MDRAALQVALAAALSCLATVPVAAQSDVRAGVVPKKEFSLAAGKPIDALPGEKRLADVRQLTFDGENAEAYWSNDGTKLVFQRRTQDQPADRIHVLDLATGETKQVSTGTGRTTCSYFLHGDKGIVFASTHHHGKEPPPVAKVERGRGYVWAVHREYDLFTV